MARARIKVNTVTKTTPAAPIVSANDNTNILTASSPLGNSEIVMSVNGGAFVAYAGLINVGNVNLPAGYYLFKIKAATGRNESAVASSPAFTYTAPSSTGATYYVSAATGSDSRTGAQAQSASTPWQTLQKVNSFTFNPGDKILFNCGETYNGYLEAHNSGTPTAPITYDKYGTGALPIITQRSAVPGASVAANWTLDSQIVTDSKSYSIYYHDVGLTATVRNLIPANYFTANASKVRIMIYSANGGTSTVNAAYIGERDLAASDYAMKAGTIQQLTFDNGAFTAVVPQTTGNKRSDWVNYAIDSTKSYVISLSINGAYTGMQGDYAWMHITDAATATSEAGQANPISGYVKTDSAISMGSFEVSDGTAKSWVMDTTNVTNFSRLWLNNVEGALAIFKESIGLRRSWFLDRTNKKLWVYSATNPATAFSSIEQPLGGLSDGTFLIHNKSNIVVQNLDIRAGYASLYNLGGDNNIIQDCIIGKDAGAYGAWIKNDGATADNGIMRRCKVDSGDKIINEWVRDAGKGSEDGIHVSTGANGWKIYANEVINWGHCDIYVENFSTTYTCNNNKVYMNLLRNPDLDYSRGLACDGVASQCTNNQFYLNFIKDCTVRSQFNAQGTKVFSNIFTNGVNAKYRLEGTSGGIGISGYGSQTPSGLMIVNNVFANMDEAGFEVLGGPGTYYGKPINCVIGNNIFYNTGRKSKKYPTNTYQLRIGNSTDVLANTFEYNLFFNSLPNDGNHIFYGRNSSGTEGMTVSAFNTKNGTNGDIIGTNQMSDPQFTNASSLNFSLLSGSPAIGAGKTYDVAYNVVADQSSVWPLSVVSATYTASWNVGSYFSQSVPNSYSLATAAKTSAGLYSADDTLLRTLWSNKSQQAGTYPIVWDGTDDFLNPIAAGTYSKAKVTSNNIQYIFQGTVGNTSSDLVGTGVYSSLDPTNNLLVIGNNVYLATGYSEGHTPIFVFATNNIQKKLEPFTYGVNEVTGLMCTDGVNIYYASYDSFADVPNNIPANRSFCYATKISDNSLVNFSSGSSFHLCVSPQAYTYPSAIAIHNEGNAIPSDIAVSSTYLFISYSGLGYVSVYNKTTGAFVRNVTLTTPTAMVCDGSYIWATTGGSTLQKYLVNSDGTFGAPAIPISGLSSVVDLRINGSILAIVDGGTNQQIKAVNTSNGVAVWTLGQLGGILTSPVVANDKFAFWLMNEDTSVKVNRGGIAFAADGSLWVSDSGNRRILHFDANRNYLEKIIYQGKTYSCFVDPNNHSRVLGNLQEFQDAATATLATSWNHKYNWEGNFIAGYALQEGIKNITTLSNGKTYGLVIVKATGEYEVVELDATTGIRYTGIKFGNGTKKMYPNGDIYAIIGGTAPNETETWNKWTLTGFSGNNPTYSGPTTPLSLTLTDPTQPQLSGAKILPWEVTSSNLLVTFKGNKQSGEQENVYHLGGYDLVNNKYKFKTSIGTSETYFGEYPPDGWFDAGNGSQYQGNVAMAIERSVIWGYNGEFWKSSQVNKWNHYLDNGLFIGQFGNTGPEYDENPTLNPAFSGNSFSPALVKEGNDYYMYENDESVHGGLLRWKITGLDTIQEQVIPLTSSFVTGSELGLIAGDVDLMQSLPFAATNVQGIGKFSRLPSTDTSSWQVKTGSLTYNKRLDRDVFVSYGNAGVATANFNLGTNSGVAQWVIKGSYLRTGMTVLNGSEFAKLQVLDNVGKVIAEMDYNTPSFGTSGYRVMGNNSVIHAEYDAPGYDAAQALARVVNKLQSLKITGTSTGITFDYAGYPSLTVPKLDSTSNWQAPTTFRMLFQSGSFTVAFKNFRFNTVSV